MILEIEDYNGKQITALDIQPYGNSRTIEINNTIGNISIADICFDDIFGTNDYKLRIQLDDINNRESIADSIVDDILSTRGGQGLMYDEEILNMYVNDFYENEMEKIRNIVDEKMSKHLKDDGITII